MSRGLAALVAWLDLRLGAADFVIRHRPGGPTRVRGRVPAAKLGAIAEFFADDLRPPGGVTVRGRFGPARSLRLRIAGPLDAGRRQQVRNFLTDLLR